jgi:hypothetical protein
MNATEQLSDEERSIISFKTYFEKKGRVHSVVRMLENETDTEALRALANVYRELFQREGKH